MIDPHVHLRDWDESHKETLKHGLSVAIRAGMDGVFEMPNTSPPITTLELAEKRIKEVDRLDLKIFHGLFMGLKSDEETIRQVVLAYNKFPRIVGLKLFAGVTVGPLAVPDLKSQRFVFETLRKLNYRGVVACHCEKESQMSHLWDPSNPRSHSSSRPPSAETESVWDIIALARATEFKGKLHICHASVPATVEIVGKARKHMAITCAVTPHHALLDETRMDTSSGVIYKVNPPLRPKVMQEDILKDILDGKVDWIESDHAPHLFSEKLRRKCPSGLPGIPYMSLLVNYLRQKGLSEARIDALTHDNIVKTYGLKIENSRRQPESNLEKEYEVRPIYPKF